MFFSSLETPVGSIGVFEENGKLVRVAFIERAEFPACRQGALTELAAAQLDEYFRGKRKSFDIPVSLDTQTPFRQKVYKALMQVSYGETASYKALASAAGNPNAARAVGSALHKNPLLILVPCHRITGKGGRLAGYAAGIEKKRFLLELEKREKYTE